MKQLGGTSGHPAVAATPEERRLRIVIEKTVGFLERVEIEHHFLGGAIDVLAILGRAVGLRLRHRDHEHVVDPQTRLPGVALGHELLGFFVSAPADDAVRQVLVQNRMLEREMVVIVLRPLEIRHGEAEIKVLFLLGLQVQLQRHCGENGVIHVIGDRHHRAFVEAAAPVDIGSCLGLFRIELDRSEQGLEAGDQAFRQRFFFGYLGKRQRAPPSTNFWIRDAIGHAGSAEVLVRHIEEALRDALADFLRRFARRPRTEIDFGTGHAGQQNEGRCLNQFFHVGGW
jgi:hypothetical protein